MHFENISIVPFFVCFPVLLTSIIMGLPSTVSLPFSALILEFITISIYFCYD